MAGRTLNRLELRKQAEQADQPRAGAPDTSPAAPPAGTMAKKASAPRKKPRAKKGPLRLRVRWGIFDASARQVAIFDYNQRAAADEKLGELVAKNKGLYYLQMVKEPMPEPAPVGAPAVG